MVRIARIAGQYAKYVFSRVTYSCICLQYVQASLKPF